MCACVGIVVVIKTISEVFLVISGQKPANVFSGNSSNDDDKSKEPSAEVNGEDALGDEPLDQSIVLVPVRFRRFNLDSHCALRSVQLQVQDLGLGFDSDETLLFKYCYGTCPDTRSNYDLTLGNLLLTGVLHHAASDDTWHNGRCCRPTGLEDAAFLDNSQHWHKLEKLSAVGCACVG